MKVKVFLNEQLELIYPQRKLIQSYFGKDVDIQVLPCPKQRWSVSQMDDILSVIFEGDTEPCLLFATPIGYMSCSAVKRGARVFFFTRETGYNDNGTAVVEFRIVEV